MRLTARAEERIAIELGAIEQRSVARRRTVGGELIAPPGASVTVVAPRAATVLAPAAANPPRAGGRVQAGQPLVRLVVLPGGDNLADLEAEVAAAEARFQNAQAKAERAEELVRAGVASQAELEDARAERSSADAAVRGARARLELLRSGASADIEGLGSLTLSAPRAGVVQRVFYSVGQTVPDGAPLLEIVDHDPLWVRAPVYVGDMADIQSGASARVSVGTGPSAQGATAVPIEGPPTADLASSSADLFFRLPNPQGKFRSGQRVSVSLELAGSSDALVAPRSAVLYDLHGGAWVYEALGERAYARRRVEVVDVIDDLALIGRGPAPGTRIVVVGAAELFSTEFGTPH